MSLLIAVAAASAAAAVAPLQPPRVADAAAHISIDGALDEPAWATAAVVRQLAVVIPDTGAPPRHPTEVRVFYTAHGLYIGALAHQPRGSLVSRLSPHDLWLESDFIQIGLDPTGRGTHGYLFGIFLGGSAADATLLPERKHVWEWDGPWRRATRVTDDGWIAEAFLPWSMFAMPSVPGAERTMGLYVARWVASASERWSWPALPPTRPQFLSAFHPMTVTRVDPGPQLVAYPYIAPGVDLRDERPGVRIGFDGFWSPTPQTRLAVSVLPDFGQIEADQLTVNLTAFETFFPEKRPFFTVDQDIFRTGRVTLVHTRRIGAPPRPPDPGPGAKHLDVAAAADILGAAKATGQAGALRYGVLAATERADDYQIEAGGQIRTARIEGRDFGAARVLWERSEQRRGGYRAIGALATVAHTPADVAVVGAVDAHLRTASGTLQLDGQAIASAASGDRGYGGWLEGVATPAQGSTHTVTAELYGKHLAVNDLGFLQRNDLVRVGYRYGLVRPMERLASERRTTVEAAYGTNQGGQRIEAWLAAAQGFTLDSHALLDVRAGWGPGRWDDRASRGNGAFRVRGRPAIRAELWSDKGRRWSVGAIVDGHGEDLGGFSTAGTAGLRLTPSEHVTIEAALTAERLSGLLVWRAGTELATYAGWRVAPRLDVRALLTPAHQLGLSAQWLLLSADPEAVWTIGGGGALVPVPGGAAPRLARGSLALQLRYRWELAPLSDLFVVYARGGEIEDGQLGGLSELAGASLSTTTVHQLALKLRYRFDL